MKVLVKLFCLLLFCFFHQVSSFDQDKEVTIRSLSVIENEEEYLLVSTLDGTLHSYNPKTGEKIWNQGLQTGPVVSTPNAKSKLATMLSSPVDGSLYMYNPKYNRATKFGNNIKDMVKETGFDEKVVTAKGTKNITWFYIDANTGILHEKGGIDGKTDVIHPRVPGQSIIVLCQSDYTFSLLNLTEVDTTKRLVSKASYKEWDSSNSENEMSSESVYISVNNDGTLFKMDKKSASKLWEKKFDSPVVALHLYESSSKQLTKINLHILAEPTKNLLENKNEFYQLLRYIKKEPIGLSEESMVFENSLYIGKHNSNDDTGTTFYALQPLIDSGNKILYLNKPTTKKELPGPGKDNYYDSKELSPKRSIVGYYPDPIPQYIQKKPSETYKTPRIDYDKYNTLDNSHLPPSKYQEINFKINEDYNSVLLLMTTILITILIFYVSYHFVTGRKSTNLKVLKNSTKGEGWLEIGQIHYNRQMVLGKGNGGTCVYKGTFDTRQVAIKRLINENCTFAEREVEMLRAKEEHENVIKYYCTEQDREFFYIALECCDMTLKTLVEETDDDGLNQYNLVPKDIMKQAIRGLHHLHQNKIVHRDVKPSNILIARRGGQARVVLSDFGLCKKVTGQTSFSHCTNGMAGTDGWIAPEMINTNQKRMTQAVDIFSMGCVFYYVLCKEHPYGPSLTRQHRISNGKFDLSKLNGVKNSIEVSDLIKRMLKMLPNLRPNTGEVLYHPYFWNAKTTLDFFEAFSNRVEKIKTEDTRGWNMLKFMERKSQIIKVLGGSNWQYKICDTVKPDLGIRNLNTTKDDNKPCYRTYQGGSVVHLLRAIRNKRTHFRELSEEVQMALGGAIEPPDQYLFYFTTKFPYLLMHTYIALSNFHEDFSEYYQCESHGKSQFQEEHDLINEELESNPPNLQAHVKNVGVPNAKYWNNTPQKSTSNSKFKKSQCDYDNNWRQKGSITSPSKNKFTENRKSKEEFHSKPAPRTNLKVDSISYADALKTSSQISIPKPPTENENRNSNCRISEEVQTNTDVLLENDLSSCVKDSHTFCVEDSNIVKVEEIENVENEDINKQSKKRKKNRRPKKK